MNASTLVPNDLWTAIEPLLPKEPPKTKGGRPRLPDHDALAGIVFVLRTGCPWRLLPKELGYPRQSNCVRTNSVVTVPSALRVTWKRLW